MEKNELPQKEESPKADQQAESYSQDPIVRLIRKAQSNPRIMAALLEADRKIAD